MESNVFDCGPEVSLSTAVARIHGISNGAASLIPTLIFENLRNFLRSRVVDLPYQNLSVSRIGDCDCYTLTTPTGDLISCGVEDYLIRQVKTTLPPEPGRLVTYDFNSIKINEALSLDLFRMH